MTDRQFTKYCKITNAFLAWLLAGYLVVILLFAFGCSTYTGKIEHGAHTHISSPRAFSPVLFDVHTITGEVAFTSESKYNHGGGDQYDWNKLIGISHSIKPDKKNVMIGWRYLPDQNLWQLGWYSNQSGNFYGYMKSVGENDTVQYDIRILPDCVLFTIGDTSACIDYSGGGICFPRHSWFGGNLPAPHDISFYLSATFK